MAAFTGTPVDSTERTAQKSSKKNEAYNEAKMNYARFSYTHAAGAGTGEINLVKLPAGEIMIYPSLSRINSSQFATNADLHLGHRAYVQKDGTAVVEDDNEFLDNADAGGGAIGSAFLLPASPTVYDTKEGLEVYAMVDTANIEDGDTIDGWVAYTQN